MAEAAQQGDDRLVELNNELKAILEERITFLTSTLKDTDRLTQQIANAEIDIRRNQQMGSKLQEEAEEIGTELETLQATTEELTGARDARRQEKFATERKIQELENDISSAGKEIEDGEGHIKDLEKELEKLERENKKLKNRVKVLEEGVTRMRKVREEYMRSIQDLNKEMTDLASSQGEGQGG
jgi:chromosome segregation ATPase